MRRKTMISDASLSTQIWSTVAFVSYLQSEYRAANRSVVSIRKKVER